MPARHRLQYARTANKKHLGTFSVHVRLTVLELASLEKKKKEEIDFF